jgi:hypothetical protein
MLSECKFGCKSEKEYYKVLRAVINAQQNAGECFAEGSCVLELVYWLLT